MRGRLSAVPRPPRVELPAPIPDTPDDDVNASPGPSSTPPPPAPPRTRKRSARRTDEPDNTTADPQPDAPARDVAAAPAPDPVPPATPAGERPNRTHDLLHAADEKGFVRIVRDLYDDQGWDDSLNMTWAIPRAVRDTVARFGADANLANKRAATTVLYLGLLQLGLEIRPNTADEDRATRRRL